MISCKGVVVCTAVWAACISHAWAAEEQDVTNLPIEQLLDLEVSTAARYGQKQSEAAAAISVVTAAEIRRYGYDTRGIFVQDDYSLSERMPVNLGLRHTSRLGGSANSPRAGIIYQLDPNATALKLLYGSAYRAPSAFEQFHSTPDLSATVRGVGLQGERIQDSGARIRASYSFADASDKQTSAWLPNSPRNQVKLNYSMPLPG